jgi:excisionase family DNA binding protein
LESGGRAERVHFWVHEDLEPPRAAPSLEEVVADERALERLRELLVPPPAYTVASLAEVLHVSPKAISNAIRRGELAAVKRGGRWYIRPEAVATWTAPEGRAVLRHHEGPARRPLLQAWSRDNAKVAP